MKLNMTRFEVKDFEKDEWQEISEKTAVEKLVDSFDQVTPLISKMLQGEEIITSHGIYRITNGKNKG
jgi:hypothetical protein